MLHNFKEMEEYILNKNIKKNLALANAQDNIALDAVIEARKRNIVNAILIGEEVKIKELLLKANEDISDYKIIDYETGKASADLACRMVRDGQADIPMKGLMQTADFMRAILNKDNHFFAPNSLLSQATLLQFDEENRFLIITDCAVNINPNVEEKIKITKNAIELANKIGINKPNVAFLSAVEKVNPKIPSTVDAKELVNRAKLGELGEVGEVAGPLALDNAISKEAAIHKGIDTAVAGNANILVVPDLCSGNIFTKGLTFFAHMKSAGTLNGSNIPVVMTSRSDTKEDKYYSILTAVLQSF